MADSAAQRKWIQTIHIAKSKTQIDDEAYRAILEGCAGVNSSKEIKTWEQYNSVMQAFKKLGFKTGYKKPSVEPQNVRNPDWISARQEYYIKGLWKLVSRTKDDASLNKFIERITGSASITWLHRNHAQKVILALRKMAFEQGLNPDSKIPE